MVSAALRYSVIAYRRTDHTGLTQDVLNYKTPCQKGLHASRFERLAFSQSSLP